MSVQDRTAYVVIVLLFVVASFGAGMEWSQHHQPEPTLARDDIVCVEWEDATGYEEAWITLEDVLALEPATPMSCGIVVAVVEGRIYLAMDEEDGYYGMISSIPAGWVIQIEEKE